MAPILRFGVTIFRYPSVEEACSNSLLTLFSGGGKERRQVVLGMRSREIFSSAFYFLIMIDIYSFVVVGAPRGYQSSHLW